MYLSDRDLTSLLPQLRFETADPAHRFEPAEQIQPSSIDLRLDTTFWRQKHARPIDLRRAKLLELSPRRYWRKTILRPGESIILKPHDMVLARTYELFSVPAGHAGKLEGRSSFGRMGLLVHCSADFINPGYRGRMPLQLVNLGRNSIRVFPYIPICQLIVIRLSSSSDRLYGEQTLFSKYMDDDGGPSYWWRDKRIKRLQETMGHHDVTERVQRGILDSIGPQEPELIERFERLVAKSRHEELTNADDLLERFANTEDRAKLWGRVRQAALVGLAPLLLATSAGAFFDLPFGWPYGWMHYLLWLFTIASLPVSILALRSDLGEYFGKKELERLRVRE